MSTDMPTVDESHPLAARLLPAVASALLPLPDEAAADEWTSRFQQLLHGAESRADISAVVLPRGCGHDGEFNGRIVECGADAGSGSGAAAAALGAQCGVLQHRVSGGVHHLSVVYLPSLPIAPPRPTSQGPVAVVQQAALQDFAGGSADGLRHRLRQLRLWQCGCSSWLAQSDCPFNAAQAANTLHGALRSGEETVAEAVSKIGEDEYWSADGSRHFALSCAVPIRRPLWLKAVLALPIILCVLAVVVLLH